MPVTYRQLTHALKHKAGVDPEATRERNEWIERGGKKLLRVTFPKVHRGDLPVGTENGIRRDLQLSRPEFIDFYACPMTAGDFEAHLERIAKD